MRILCSLGILLLIGITSCGHDHDGVEGTSQLDYISWSVSNIKNATIADVRKAELSVCLQGSVNPQDLERAQSWSVKALLTWMRAIVVLDESAANHINLSCNQPDLTIRLRAGSGTSFASPGITTIYLTRPYGTWTHEFGHAFAALGDIYSSGTAGQCRSGQPQSLMCWGAYGPRANQAEWSTLWPDDIAGVQKNYRTLFG